MFRRKKISSEVVVTGEDTQKVLLNDPLIPELIAPADLSDLRARLEENDGRLAGELFYIAWYGDVLEDGTCAGAQVPKTIAGDYRFRQVEGSETPEIYFSEYERDSIGFDINEETFAFHAVQVVSAALS